MRLAILALSLACCPALAQQARFLTPHGASVNLGDLVALEIREADGPILWPLVGVEHFFARTAWTQENRDSVEVIAGMPEAAAWTTDRPGVLLLGLDMGERTESVSPGQFRRFLTRSIPESHRADLGPIPASRDLRLRRHECAKAIVRVRHDGPQPVSIATSKAGQRVEIRALMDPTALMPGADLAVRVYAPIDGAKSGIVTATNTSTGDELRAIADESAIANIRIGSAGRWRVEFHAVGPPVPGQLGVDLNVYTATLTFDVEEANP